MSDGLRVLWREGLFLTPQHFQVLDRYHEWLSHVLVSINNPMHWGISRLEIEEDAISNWLVSIRSIRAILRDGTVIDCPETDNRPPSRSFNELLTPDKRALTVYLGVGRADLERPSVKLPDQDMGTQVIRYERVLREMNDAVRGSRPREMELLSKRLEIRFEGEAVDHLDLLPIAKVEVRGSGRPSLATDFLPPCMSLRGAPLWMDTCNWVLQQSTGLITDLRAKLTYGSDQCLKLSGADLSNYMQTRELMSTVPALMHLYNVPESHPLQLYQLLSGLAGRLSLLIGVQADSLSDEFPPYQHDAPARGLLILRERLRKMLALVGRAGEHEFPLTQIVGHDNRWQVDLAPARFGERDEYFIWARSDLSEERMEREFPTEFKVAAPQRVNQLMVFALPGISLVKSFPPPSLPAPGKGVYFRIDRGHQLWREVTEAKELVISTAQVQKYPGLQMRFHIVSA